MLSRLTSYYKIVIPVVGIFLLITYVFIVQAAMHEDIGTLNAKALSLANTVTADPPGLMAIHYNPAGLSRVKEGKTVSVNTLVAGFSIKGKFKSDPDFYPPGFGEPDPLDGKEGANANAVIYLPGVDKTLKLPLIAAPSSFQIAYKAPKSKWTLAIGSYMPYAGGWTFEGKDNPVRYQCKEMYQEHILAAAPSASYQINDNLSVGLSVGFGISALGMKMDMRAPSDLLSVIRPLGELLRLLNLANLPEGWGVGTYDDLASVDMAMNDNFTPSYNLGLLWQPKDFFAFGATYQSAAKTKLEGKYKFKFNQQLVDTINGIQNIPLAPAFAQLLDIPTQCDPVQKGMCNTEFEFPQMLHFGIMVKPMKSLKFLCDYHWANWSAMQDMQVKFDQNITMLQLIQYIDSGPSVSNAMILEMGLKDTWNVGYGLEYEPFDGLFFRLGYEKRQSSVPENKYGLILPLPDLDFYGAGIGIKRKDGIDIDLGAGLFLNKSFKVHNNSSTLLNSTDADKMIYNPYAGLNFEQETLIYAGALTVTMPMDLALSMLDDLNKKFNPF